MRRGKSYVILSLITLCVIIMVMATELGHRSLWGSYKSNFLEAPLKKSTKILSTSEKENGINNDVRNLKIEKTINNTSYIEDLGEREN